MVKVDNALFFSEEGAKELPERLRRLFVYHATKPHPVRNALASYDHGRQELSIHGAEAIAEKAFRNAIKTARTVDLSEFGDRWARAALGFVMGDATDITLLTQQGGDQMSLLRDRNVHRTKRDLIVQARAMDERLQREERTTSELAEQQREDERIYIDARRASFTAFLGARARALTGLAKNAKPFSQRFIKGLVLAKVAGARLTIGSLSDSIGAALADRYGEALALMQNTEVVATGREVPELGRQRGVSKVAGIYINSVGEVVLANPQVILQADVVIIDPRTVFHEFQHARQHLACEESVLDMQPQERYETEVIEWKAKQAEADYLKEFGVLY